MSPNPNILLHGIWMHLGGGEIVEALGVYECVSVQRSSCVACVMVVCNPSSKIQFYWTGSFGQSCMASDLHEEPLVRPLSLHFVFYCHALLLP